MNGRLVAIGALVSAVCARLAAAQPEDARTHYEHGSSAYSHRDFSTAAHDFAAADVLVPNDAVLELAIDCARLTTDAAFLMGLVDRAAGRSSASLQIKAELARVQAKGQVGKLVVHCPECAAVEVDGRPWTADASGTWMELGDHEVTLDVARTVTHRTARLIGGETVVVEAKDPFVKPDEPLPQSTWEPASAPRVVITTEPRRERLVTRGAVSPVWFGLGVAVTAVMAGATIGSFLDTASQYNAFQAAPTSALANSGGAAQTRTIVLGAITGAVALGTVVLGVVTFRSTTQRVAVGLSPTLGGARLSVAF